MKICRLIKISLLCIVLSGSGTFASEKKVFNNGNLVSELEGAYVNAFYPGVIRYADEILSSQKNSRDSYKAELYKGESLYKMGRIQEALVFLQSVSSHDSSGSVYAGIRSYWEGMCLFELRKFDKASLSFYKSASSLSKKSESKLDFNYYSHAILMGARTFYELNMSEEAIPLYEYVAANGRSFEQTEYQDCLYDLLQLYNEQGYFVKAENLYNLVKSADFDDYSRYSYLLCYGQTLEGLSEYKKAYEVYCKVLQEGPSSVAAAAMKRAYNVSSSHKKEVASDPGSIIAMSRDRLSEYPELLCEFWTRLAIDSYNDGNYEKALGYFTEAEKTSSELLSLIACLYKAEIALRTGTDNKTGALKALQVIDETKSVKEISEDNTFYHDINLARTRYYGILCDWVKCIQYADASSLSRSAYIKQESSYWKALALYNKGQYQEAENLINAGADTEKSNVQILLAHIYARQGKSHEADVLFYSLGEKNQLDNNGRLDYSRTLLNAGHLVSATKQSSIAQGGEADYLSGLAFFNRRRWSQAGECMKKVISHDELDQIYYSYALFYLAYCDYRLGNFEDASKNFNRFISENSTHQMYWNALMLCARSDIQLLKYEQAIPLVEKAVETAVTQENKQDAVMLCASCYSDAKQYDKALLILKPYENQKSDFALECRFKMAEVYVLKKDYGAADKTYADLVSEKSYQSLRESACYRRGELSYSTGNYKRAVSLFDEYCKKWYNGRYYQAALYFAADALNHCGNKDMAVLYYRQIIDSKQSSAYKYDAEKKCISLYVELDEYDSAVKQAESLLNEYGKQAEDDGVKELLEKLYALSTGTNRTLSIKEYEYKKAGSNLTLKGRILGCEYAEIMYRETKNGTKSASFAESLYEQQLKNIDEEYMYALSTVLLLGRINRDMNKNRESAQYFLKAAEYSRMTGDSETAASSLYKAVESFDAAGLYGDSKAAYESLKLLYPASQYVKSASKIVK